MIKYIAEKDINIVTFQTNRIDAFNIEMIKDPVMQLIKRQHNRILFDLDGVNYIDSTGFAMFLFLRRTAIANYSVLKLCGMSKQVESLFRTLNLDSVFEIYSNSEECLQNL